MKVKTIELYDIRELKEKFPDGFEKALENWRNDHASDIFWSYEIMDSLKAIFATGGINLIRWSISGGSPSWVRFEMPEDGEDYLNPLEDYAGRKAYNWIKANILDGANFRRVTYDKRKGGKGWRYDITKTNGESWSCEFTGVCYDHDFIESLLDDIRGGCTPQKAFSNLADTASNLLQQEYDDQMSEEYFIDHAEGNEYTFRSNGEMENL